MLFGNRVHESGYGKIAYAVAEPVDRLVDLRVIAHLPGFNLPKLYRLVDHRSGEVDVDSMPDAHVI